ncbi:MlaD family protein [Actinomycetospora aeridis]|uniref:MCE family protein n=1 Tax=Actinomycetospora aeridis TaxID=3129231 RepID=A0ABU8NBT6_9PSEU
MSARTSLRRTWRRLRRVPGLGRDVLVLVGVAALGVTAAVIILSQLDVVPPWSGYREIKVEVTDAVAVSPGNSQEVRIAGVPVGLIEDAEATDHDTSILTLSIEPGHPIFDNARAVLRPKNPLNEMYVSLAPGGPPGRELGADDVLPATQTQRPVQVEEALGGLDERSRTAMTALISESDEALARAPQALPAGLDATSATLDRLRPVVTALAERRDNIRRLVGTLSRVATAAGRDDARLTSLLDSTQATLATLTRRDDELARTLEQLPGLSEDLRRALASTSTLTDELDPTLDELRAAAPELPSALARFGDTAGSLRDVAGRAAPVVGEARPVLADLRPAVTDLRGTLEDVRPVSRWADDATAQVAPWMYDLQAFFTNTNSVFSVGEPGGRRIGRGHLSLDLTQPDGVLPPARAGTNTYRDGESPLGPYPAAGSGGPR